MAEQSPVLRREAGNESGYPPVSLIICSRDRASLLAQTVDSIFEGSAIPDELIILDQSAQPDESLARLGEVRSCRVRYTHSNSAGLSRALNEAVRYSSHDLLVFTHDDVRLDHQWFQAIVDAQIQAGKRSVITGRVLPGETEVEGGFVPTLKEDPEPACYEGRIEADVLFPLNMSMYRSAFVEMGGFDERLGPGTPYPGAEDNDFGYRLLEAGYRILYVPQAALYHRAWRNNYLGLRWSYGRSQGGFYAKHLSFTDRHMLRRLFRELARRVRRSALLKGGWRTAVGDAVYVAGLFSAMFQWLLTSRNSASAAGRRP